MHSGALSTSAPTGCPNGGGVDTEKRMSMLKAIGSRVNIVNLRVLNISNITLRKNIKREPVETYIEDSAPPTKEMTIIDRPYTKRTQTALHGDASQKPGEIDIIMTPK